VSRWSGPRRGRAVALGAGLLLALAAAGCGSDQSTLDPHSHQARKIDELWWWMLGISLLGLAVVVALLTLAYVRRRRGSPDERAGWAVVITSGIALPILVLSALFVVSDVLLIKTTEAPAAGSTQMTVRVIAHQWWWEFRFPGRPDAITANELHIPVGTRVNLVATTADVIHSFWVPELNRKIDTIPDQENRILLEADRRGVYRGQCAEFCGLQHARMSVLVYADPPAQFRAWLARQAEPAPAPTTARERRGMEVVTSGACSACHTVRGTSAAGDTGPDLTHVGGRTTLGAVTVPNDPASLVRWIEDSQDVKPGNQMPDIRLPRSDLDGVVAYLRHLR
jgi:cytochrome c oxidase subunit 2